LSELAFEPARGYHAVVGDSPSGSRVSVKGAPEIVLPRCTTWRHLRLTVMDRRTRLRLDAEVERLASRDYECSQWPSARRQRAPSLPMSE